MPDRKKYKIPDLFPRGSLPPLSAVDEAELHEQVTDFVVELTESFNLNDVINTMLATCILLTLDNTYDPEKEAETLVKFIDHTADICKKVHIVYKKR